MGKCIGGITHDVFGSVGALLSHSPDKSFGAYTRFGTVSSNVIHYRLDCLPNVSQIFCVFACGSEEIV